MFQPVSRAFAVPGHRACTRWLIVALVLQLTSWWTTAATDTPLISPEELLAGTVLELDPGIPAIVSKEEVMALSDEMRDFLEQNVDANAGSFAKLHQLVHTVITSGTFGLEYEGQGATRTAAQAFKGRKANCLSFTNMFVVMARGVGLDASFQEVDIPPEWTLGNETYVLNLHINIYLDLGVVGKHVVDFNIEDFQADYDMRVISDERAMAHFFNNLGAELMQAGRSTEAFLAFHAALAENDRSFAPAWNNLGTLYNRLGHSSHAEAAFLQALEIDKYDRIAMSNLYTLYDRRGDHERAASYLHRVNTHRRQNPYYRCHLAREALAADDIETAIDHLKYASRKIRNDDRIYALLGLAYLRKGDSKKSLRWLARAEELARTEELRGAYSSKIARIKAVAG